MKKRAETLNDKVKSIGNECVLSTGADRVAVMAAALTALNRQAEAEGSFWLWAEAVKLLGLNQAQQLLAGMLWGYSLLQKKELSAELFWGICREVEIYCQETLTELPVWIYEADNTVVLSPVLTGWLEGTTSTGGFSVSDTERKMLWTGCTSGRCRAYFPGSRG